MNDKKRLKFKCWHCQEEYTLPVQGNPQLIVECPYCEHEAVVDLIPFRSGVTPAFKGLDQPAAPLDLETLDLPDVLLTRPRS